MLPLRELQGAMAASVLRGMDAPLAPIVRADGIEFSGRLQVYRNNTFSSLTAALKDSFPVVCQLVDERFFGYAAQEYIRAHPPRAPRLAEYGGDFAGFLAGFEPVRHLVYLSDVARLEWAVNAAYHAVDAPALDPARIAAVPQDRYARLMFISDPSVHLFASEFPVDRIWHAHQPGGDLESRIELSSGGCRLLIDRHDRDIRFLALDAAGFALAAALCAGATLQAAYEKAAAIAETFDLIAALSTHLTRGTLPTSPIHPHEDGGPMNAPAEAAPTGVVGFYRSICKAFERVPIALPVLVMRVGVALVIWRAGQSKLPLGNDATIGLFRDVYEVPLLPPEFAAYLATMIEIACPVLLLLGVLTRPAAAILLAQTIVIQFIFPENYPDHLLWAGPLLYLLLRGPGKWSFDAAIRDRIGGGK